MFLYHIIVGHVKLPNSFDQNSNSIFSGDFMPSGRQTSILRVMTVGNQSDNTDNVIILESLHSLFSLQLISIC